MRGKEKIMSEKILDDLMDVVEGEGKVTYVCFVMDHSGSMVTHADVLKKNFNEQLETLKQETGDMETLVSVVDFADRAKVSKKLQDVNEMKKMSSYRCHGCTALYDAIALGISEVQVALDKDKREDKAALVLIQTDGYENNSVELAGAEGQKNLKELIKGLEETGIWTFVFLGENIDREIATDMGFQASNTMNFQSYDQANVETVSGISAYYSARNVGETQVKNFYENTTGDPKDVKEESKTENAREWV